MSLVTFDMNRCNQCPKLAKCPDRKIFHEHFFKAVEKANKNEGGTRSATLILSCKEPQLIAEEAAQEKE